MEKRTIEQLAEYLGAEVNTDYLSQAHLMTAKSSYLTESNGFKILFSHCPISTGMGTPQIDDDTVHFYAFKMFGFSPKKFECHWVMSIADIILDPKELIASYLADEYSKQLKKLDEGA